MSNPFKAGDFVVSLESGKDLSVVALESGKDLSLGGVYLVKEVHGDWITHADNVGHPRNRLYTRYRAAIAGQDYMVPTAIQPSGHHPDGSGVQKHSAGGLYPYVLCYRDSKEAGRKYDVGIIGPGIKHVVWCKSYDAAVDVTLLLKGQP